MKIKALYSILALLVTLLTAADGRCAAKLFGPEQTDNDSLPVNITAIKLSYDKRGENLIAKGDVEITQGNRVLKADYVKINLSTKDTVAKGSVELNEDGDILYCDSFNINLDTQLGQVDNARLFVKQDNLHITGKNIKKLGVSTYEITDGTVTTCDAATPPWRIDAGKINVTVDGYAWVKDSVFRIKKIPIAYLPFAVLPVKTSRQTGLLFPEIGHSSRRGAELNNSFFWAINENTDSTIWLDAASKKGLGTGLEYRFRLAEDTWGKVYGYYTKEKQNYFDDEYTDERDRQQDRSFLNFEGEHYFSQDFYVKAQGSYISDREFYDDYREEVRRSSSEVDKTNIGSKPYDESLVFFNKNWETCNLLVNTEYYKNLTYSDHYVPQPLPQVAFSTMRLPIGDSKLFYQFDTGYNYFYRDEGRKGHRLDAYPRISLPLSKDGWLKLDTELGLRALVYKNIEDDEGLNDSTIFPTVKSYLTADFNRVYAINGEILQKLRHTIEPGLFYEYLQDDDQDDVPYFDMPETLYRRHRYGYFLKNRVAGLFNTPTGEYQEDEMGYLILGQSYNIIHPQEGYYIEGERDKDYSDVYGDLRLNVTQRFYFRTKAAYIPYESRLRYYKALFAWSNQLDEYLTLGYVYEWERFKGYLARGRFKLLSSVFAFFSFRYNNNRSDKLDSEFGIDYFSQCWGSQISVETRGASAGRRSETNFNYKFYLKGLGK